MIVWGSPLFAEPIPVVGFDASRFGREWQTVIGEQVVLSGDADWAVVATMFSRGLEISSSTQYGVHTLNLSDGQGAHITQPVQITVNVTVTVRVCMSTVEPTTQSGT